MVDAVQEETFHWPPLESDPEIFTSYLQKIGMPANWMFSELFGFEEELLAMIPQPSVGVVVATQRLKKKEDKDRGDPATKAKWYMKQTGTLDNACGIIAAFHAVANNRDSVVLDESCALAEFFAKTVDQTPEERATTMENETSLQNTHKSFAAQGQSN